MRSPVEAPGRCEGPTLPMVLTPPASPGPRFAADEDSATWLAPDGQPFVWPVRGAAPPAAVEATPWRSGERYVALARGQGFSAGLREDGSLWTWGNNYQGRLGLPQLRETNAPQFLLSNVAQVIVNANVGLALRRDGTLWVWGDVESVAPPRPVSPEAPIDPSPRQIFDDVSQAVFGPQGDVLAASVACDIHPVNNRRILEALRHDFGASEVAINRWCAIWIVSGFDAIEALLAADAQCSDFCFGDTPTLADVYLVPQVESARRFKVDIDRRPLISAVDAACARLAAFRDAAPSAQPDAS